MFDTDIDRSSLDADATLRHVASMQTLRQRAEVAVLEDAAHWADLHGVVESTGSPALPGAERLVRLGGVGTPQTCEFCPAELGAELGMSPAAAAMLIGDALDLRHRLPVLWRRIRAGQVKAWIGRQVAVETRELNVEAVTAVDRRVARYAHSLTGAGCPFATRHSVRPRRRERFAHPSLSRSRQAPQPGSRCRPSRRPTPGRRGGRAPPASRQC